MMSRRTGGKGGVCFALDRRNNQFIQRPYSGWLLPKREYSFFAAREFFNTIANPIGKTMTKPGPGNAPMTGDVKISNHPATIMDSRQYGLSRFFTWGFSRPFAIWLMWEHRANMQGGISNYNNRWSISIKPLPNLPVDRHTRPIPVKNPFPHAAYNLLQTNDGQLRYNAFLHLLLRLSKYRS